MKRGFVYTTLFRQEDAMDKTYDVVALGELLIDFTETGNSPQGNPLLEVNPGGAPGNVLSMLQNYGEKTAFIGKVGEDMFGRILLDAVGSCGIDTSGIVVLRTGRFIRHWLLYRPLKTETETFLSTGIRART